MYFRYSTYYNLDMKPVKNYTVKKVATKGVRLNWTPLHEVTPVELTPNLTKGHLVSLSKPKSEKSHFLVP